VNLTDEMGDLFASIADRARQIRRLWFDLIWLMTHVRRLPNFLINKTINLRRKSTLIANTANQDEVLPRSEVIPKRDGSGWELMLKTLSNTEPNPTQIPTGSHDTLAGFNVVVRLQDGTTKKHQTKPRELCRRVRFPCAPEFWLVKGVADLVPFQIRFQRRSGITL
jgi:hypothetical protein